MFVREVWKPVTSVTLFIVNDLTGNKSVTASNRMLQIFGLQ
jgi:hypothetical protein